MTKEHMDQKKILFKKYFNDKKSNKDNIKELK
jgi:hypothetical protein